MYSVTSQFEALALSNSRSWQIYATVDASTYYQADIVDFTLEDSLTADGYIVWGSGTSRKLTLKLNGTIPVAADEKIKLYVGLNDEYILLGTFYVDLKATVYTNISTTLVGYDLLSTYSNIKFNNDELHITSDTIQDAWEYIQTIIATDTTNTPEFTPFVVMNPIGGSVRDALFDLAELDGRIVLMDASTELVSLPIFVAPDATAISLTADDYLSLVFNSPAPIRIDTVSCGSYTSGDGLYGEIVFDNVNMTQEILDGSWGYFPIEYYAYTLESKGLPHIQVGDLIHLTDVYNDVYDLIVGTHTLVYNGTLVSTFTANAPDGSIVSMNRSTRERVDYSNEATNEAISSLIIDIATNAPSPIPAGADITKLYLTPNDKLYLTQLIAEGYNEYTELNDVTNPRNMFYVAAGVLKDDFDQAYADLSGLAADYPTIYEVEVLTEYDLEDIVDINERVTAFNTADRNLSSYLIKFFKNESGNTIIDEAGVHIGTFQNLPTLNDDGSYFDVGGLESLFSVNISTPANATITSNGHGLIYGDIIYIITSGELPTGMTTETKYWVSPIDTNTFNIATSESNLIASSFVITSGSQSGDHAFYIGGPNSRLTASTLEFKYGRDVKVSIESDKTKVVNAELNGINVIKNEVTLPELIYLSDVMTIEKKGTGLRLNFR